MSMESPAVLEKFFLDAAVYGKTQLLRKLVGIAVSSMGEGRGKRACAAQKSREGHNALHLAAHGGHTESCRYLFEDLNFDVNSTNLDGETPLFWAAIGGHFPTVTYLIQNGADVSTSNNIGSTPLHNAAGSGLPPYQTPLNTNYLQFRVNRLGTFLLFYVSMASLMVMLCLGSMETVTLLISKGANVHAISQKGMPLDAAASSGHAAILKYLLDLKADPNSSSPFGFSSLTNAMLGDSIECVEMLLKSGSDPNDDCSGSQLAPIFFGIVEQCGVDMIRCLLNAGADPNKTAPWGVTPLEHAVVCGRFEVVQLLFPVTSCISSYPDWSINGLMRHILSQEDLVMSMVKKAALHAKSKGNESFKRKNYINALFWYSLAIAGDPSDAKCLSNRSLCYALLYDGKPALEDAQTCVRLAPDWAKAHYREGAAWKVLKDYEKAVEAFARALAVESGNKEIETAYREALAERFKALKVRQYN